MSILVAGVLSVGPHDLDMRILALDTTKNPGYNRPADLPLALYRYNEFGGGANPNTSPICNSPYTVTAPNGNSITVRILDKCQACDSDAPHIDLTAGAFQALGYPLSQGVVQGVVYGPAVRILFCKLPYAV